MKTKRKKRLRKTRGKGIFILPNLFTSASLFGGFYATIAAINGRYEAAAMAIIISGIFDALDGRIARMTGATSRFGIEYDSLSDLIAFGVAPALLVFRWALEPFGRLGWLAAFMYVICGALRLARFNVQKDVVAFTHFRGLPIPAAACFIASLVLFACDLDIVIDRESTIIFITYSLSFLMVSTIHYPSFKEFDIRKQKPFNVLVSIILICTFIAYRPMVMFFFIMILYIASGPMLTIRRLYGRYLIPRKGEEAKPSHEGEREIHSQNE